MNTEALKIVLRWIGALVVAGCVIMMIYYAFDALRNVVLNWRWNYKYRHRFDKPPTAKCYCKDCKYHVHKGSDDYGPCSYPGISIWTPDNGFCYEAEPMTRNEANRNEADRR